MNGFSYVYILHSDRHPSRHYVGLTDDLRSRLKAHNRGKDVYTAKYRPWHIKTAIAFRDRKRASAFEIYRKSPSGRAFAKKRL